MRRSNGRFKPELDVGGTRLAAGEGAPEEGSDEGPAPQALLAASLAACASLTIETYAERRGWEVGEVVVAVDYEPAERGSPTRCRMIVRLPASLPEEQCERLMQVAAKCPVHRTLDGEIMFDELLELSEADTALPDGSGPRRRSFRTWWRRRSRRSDGEALPTG